MKEYCTIAVKCIKELELTDVFSLCSERLKYNSNIFCFQNLSFAFLSKKKQKMYDDLHMEHFAYQDKSNLMVSNLDNNWQCCNGEATESLNKKEWVDLVNFASQLRGYDTFSHFIGVDEIMWDNTSVEKGTYGFRKPDSCYGLGLGYLSNCIIVGKTSIDKTYTAFLVCEKKFRPLNVIQEFVDYLGTIKYETTMFAPDDNAERIEWKREAVRANIRLQSALAGVRSLGLVRISNNWDTDEKVKINIQKQIKNALCVDGWKIRKADFDEWPTLICKEKGDTEICLSIISGHNGHHLQSIITYKSKKFSLHEHIYELSVSALDEAYVELYFSNAKKILDYIYDAL